MGENERLSRYFSATHKPHVFNVTPFSKFKMIHAAAREQIRLNVMDVVNFETRSVLQGGVTPSLHLVPSIARTLLGELEDGSMGKTLLSFADTNGLPITWPLSLESLNVYCEWDGAQWIFDHAAYHMYLKHKYYADQMDAAWAKSRGQICWCALTCRKPPANPNKKTRKTEKDGIKCLGILVPTGAVNKQGSTGYRYYVITAGGVDHLRDTHPNYFECNIVNGEMKFHRFLAGTLERIFPPKTGLEIDRVRDLLVASNGMLLDESPYLFLSQHAVQRHVQVSDVLRARYVPSSVWTMGRRNCARDLWFPYNPWGYSGLHYYNVYMDVLDVDNHKFAIPFGYCKTMMSYSVHSVKNQQLVDWRNSSEGKALAKNGQQKKGWKMSVLDVNAADEKGGRTATRPGKGVSKPSGVKGNAKGLKVSARAAGGKASKGVKKGGTRKIGANALASVVKLRKAINEMTKDHMDGYLGLYTGGKKTGSFQAPPNRTHEDFIAWCNGNKKRCVSVWKYLIFLKILKLKPAMPGVGADWKTL